VVYLKNHLQFITFYSSAEESDFLTVITQFWGEK
jgi:hypothetical protein